MTLLTCTRFHDFSMGHRVAGHEGACALLHGHNYRVHFTAQATATDVPLDNLGRVVDFSVLKAKMCQWLEDNFDHRTVIWDLDPAFSDFYERCIQGYAGKDGARSLALPDDGPEDMPLRKLLLRSLVFVPFNPTAENLARYLLDTIGPMQLRGTGVKLVRVVVEETRKCSATAEQCGGSATA